MRIVLTALTTVFLYILAGPSATALESPPLASFIGRWSGSGSIVLASGAREGVRCDVTNVVGNGALEVRIKCATKDRVVVAHAQAKFYGQRLRGTWHIVDPSAAGTLSGSLMGDTIRVALEGTFQGSLSMSARESDMTVTLVAKDIGTISVGLRRSSK